MHGNLTFTLTLTQTLNGENTVYKGCVHMYTTSKRIELESPGCSGFEANLQNFKAWAFETF